MNSNIISIDLSAQMPELDIKPIIGRKWVLNGDNNNNFKMYKDASEDSPTNSSIINSYAAYIYADGLQDRNGEIKLNADGEEILNTKKLNVEKYLSKSDTRLIVTDYKTYGSFAVQVIWNAAKNKADKRPIQIKYFPVNKLGLSIDKYYNVVGYWYSWDWCNRGRYIPVELPKYDGIYKDNDVEVIIFNRPSSSNFFAKPDWVSGLKYAMLEGQLATSSYAHTVNGFQGGKMVNFNNGVPEDENVKQGMVNEVKKSLKGVQNTNQLFFTFNDSADTAPTVIDMGVPDVNQQYVYFSEECERKLIVAHSASPVIFASTKDGSGLSNNADEIEMATALMYRKSINPMREVILDGLGSIFKNIDCGIKLEFMDFPSFSGDKRSQVAG